MRGRPELHRALDAMADEHVYLEAPSEGGRSYRWLPCDRCTNVVSVPTQYVALVCRDCMPITRGGVRT